MEIFMVLEDFDEFTSSCSHTVAKTVANHKPVETSFKISFNFGT